MLTGVLLLAASVFKLGFIADFISQPVLAGFKAGTGLLIAVGRSARCWGSTRPATTSSEKAKSALTQLGDSTGRRRRWRR